jgi:D-glycero-alpha-D-manno-heptose-7-phosphate kinase
MIISKTPYRISFFGGGSDYPVWYTKNGGEVISATINKYLYISLRELPKFFNHNLRISYSRIEEVKKISQIKHKVVKNALLNYNIKKNLEIHYDGDLPSRSGMGSSSCFVVGLINALESFNNNKKFNKKFIAKKSIHFEQKILKEYVGSQDQIACTYGGFNSIIFKKNSEFLVENIKTKSNFISNLNKNLVLLYTGQQRTAQEIAKTFIHKINKEKKKEIYAILDCVRVAKKLIKTSNLNDFGLLLDESWKIKKSLAKNITNSKIDIIYQNAKKYGSIGGKILGAGGGGFFLFYVPEYKKNYFLKKMNFLTHVPFKFETLGTQIIVNNS